MINKEFYEIRRIIKNPWYWIDGYEIYAASPQHGWRTEILSAAQKKISGEYTILIYHMAATLRYANATQELVGQAILNQNGLCPICKKPLQLAHALDHDHITGKFRGVLHPRCNAMEFVYLNWKQYLEKVVVA